MAKMIATCGHEISQIPHRPVAVKAVIQDGVHAISWKTLCRDCISEYRRLGRLLETTRDQEDWLHSGVVHTPNRYR